MATIKIKRATTAGAAPAALSLGELAVNTADARLWVGNAANMPVELGTGASASQPPAVLRAVLDGYALHAWNNPRLSGLYASPCLITIGASAAGVPAGFTRQHVFGDTGAPFVAGGGKPVTSGGATSFPCVTPSGSTAVARHWRVSTLLDGTQCAFHLDSDATAGGGYRFLVDGKYVSLAGTLSGSGADRWYTLRFAGRGKRRITVEGYGSLRFWGAACPDSDTLLNPLTGVSSRVVVVGDSNQEAYAQVLKGDGPVAMLGDYLGVDDIWASGVYGTGFMATNFGANYNYGQRRGDWLDASPAAMIWYLSINDALQGYTVSQTLDAMLTELAAARAALGPMVPLIVHGAITTMEKAVADGYGPLFAAMETSAADAISALNDPYAAFISTYNSGTSNPLTGTGSGTGNWDLYMNTALNHFTAQGNNAVALVGARRVAEVLSAMLGAELPQPLPPQAATLAMATSYPKRTATPKIAGDMGGTALTTQALTAARQYFVPLVVPRAVVLSGLRISVTTASAGSASVGLYANTTDASGNDSPGTLLVSATGLGTGATGNKDGGFSAPVLLEPGALYWVSVIGSAAATLRALAVGSSDTALGRTVNNTTAITYLYAAGSGSTLPATAAATPTAGTGNTPALYLIEV